MKEQIMNIISKMVTERMEVECEVEFKKVEKNNGVVLQAIVIKEAGENVLPTIYIDEMILAVERKEKEIKDVVEEILFLHKKKRYAGKFGEIVEDMSKESIIKNAVYQLVNRQKNAARLENSPHKDMLDLTALYRVILGDCEEGTASFIVSNALCEKLEIGAVELDEAAIKNTAERCDFKIMSIGAVMANMAGIHEVMLPESDIPMYVLTNADGIHGATILMYKEYLEELSDKLQDDLYILPSSIHEVLAIPSSLGDPQMLTEMVGEVNATEVDAEEVLGNQIYKYIRETGELEVM